MSWCSGKQSAEPKTKILLQMHMCDFVVVKSNLSGLSSKLNIFLIDYSLLMNNMLLSRSISALFASLIISQYVGIPVGASLVNCDLLMMMSGSVIALGFV